jgi:hypothetical protein
MKRLLIPRLRSGLAFALLLLGLSACGTVATSEPESEKPEAMPTTASLPALPDLGPAPELTNDVWLNVDAPLRLANLRGKVVAIDMWTFG